MKTLFLATVSALGVWFFLGAGLAIVAFVVVLLSSISGGSSHSKRFSDDEPYISISGEPIGTYSEIRGVMNSY